MSAPVRDLPADGGGNYYALYIDQKEKAEALYKDLSGLQLGLKLSQRTIEELRRKIVELDLGNTKLRQEIDFYQKIMRPGASAGGFGFGDLKVTKTNDDRIYQYSLVVVKPGSNDEVEGHLEFLILGKQNGKDKSYHLKSLSATIGREEIPLKFKYFVRIEGEMVLPEGFVARQIELKAVDAGSKKVTSRKYEFNQ